MMTDDEKQWTRLINGELSFSEQRAILATLDDTPHGWKRLALGLLEAEAFRRELRSCLQDGPFSPVGEKVAEGRMRGSRADRASSSVQPPHPNPLPRNGGEGTGGKRQWQSGELRSVRRVMACLVGLICFGLGMGIEHFRLPAVPETPPVSMTFSSDKSQTQHTMKLVFADGPSGAQSVEVPVIEAQGNQAQELLQQSAIPDEWRRKLEAQGYVIHEKRKYVPVTLANGRQGIAPVSDVMVEQRPVVFQ